MPGDQRRITINVGGTRYTTTPSTLLSQENSYFTCILSRDWNDEAQAELFIDRDGEMFKHVLRFFRASPQGKVDLVQSLSHADKRALADEASFFQLGNLSRLLEEPAQPKEVRKDAQPFREVSWCPLVESLNTDYNRKANAEFVAAVFSQNWEVLACDRNKTGWWMCLLKKR